MESIWVVTRKAQGSEVREFVCGFAERPTLELLAKMLDRMKITFPGIMPALTAIQRLDENRECFLPDGSVMEINLVDLY